MQTLFQVKYDIFSVFFCGSLVTDFDRFSVPEAAFKVERRSRFGLPTCKEKWGRDAVKKVGEDPPVRDRDSERKKGGTGIVRDELRLKTRGRRRWKWSRCLSDFFPVFLSYP